MCVFYLTVFLFDIKRQYFFHHSMFSTTTQFCLFPFWRENFLPHPQPPFAVCFSLRESQHRWIPVWCFFHLSNFWLISQLHYANACFRSCTQHTSLCANGLSASLRLGVQLRGDSLISHLAVLFPSCRVIMPEVDVRVRNGLYLKEDTHEFLWKNRLLLLFAPVCFLC